MINLFFDSHLLGGFRKLFSTRFFVPWSKLSFTLIICQFTYLIYSLASTRTVFTYDRMTAFKEVFSGYLFTFILGNFLFLFFEAPMNNILKTYLGIKRRSEISQTHSSNDPKQKKL